MPSIYCLGPARAETKYISIPDTTFQSRHQTTLGCKSTSTDEAHEYLNVNVSGHSNRPWPQDSLQIFPTNMFLFSCGLAASPCVHTRVCSSPYLQVPLPLSRASIANVLNFSRKIFPVLQHSCILYVPRSVNLRFYTSAELGTINLSSKGSPAQPTSDESVTMQRANNLTYV